MKAFLQLKKAPLFILCTFYMLPISAHAQSVLDPYAIPFTSTRDDNFMWVKTVWQRIDLREKMNHTYYYPTEPSQDRMSLFDNIIMSVLVDPVLTVYSAGVFGQDDMFTTPLSRLELERLLIRRDTVQTPCLDGSGMCQEILIDHVETEEVLWYDIKEKWFIDKERSVMDVRILGICPVVAVRDSETGEFRGHKRLFWIHYPTAKHLIAQWPAYDHQNDLQYVSFDDFFKMRKFTSNITKVSNVYDRSINEYASGKEALLIAEEEKKKLFNMEHDLWEY